MQISFGVLKEYLSTVGSQDNITDALKTACSSFEKYIESTDGFGVPLYNLPEKTMSLIENFINTTSSSENNEFLEEIMFWQHNNVGVIDLLQFRQSCLAKGLDQNRIKAYFRKICLLSAFGILEFELSLDYSHNFYESDVSKLLSLLTINVSDPKTTIQLLTIIILTFKSVDDWKFDDELEIYNASVRFVISETDILRLYNRSLFSYLRKQIARLDDLIESNKNLADDLKSELEESKSERNAFVANLLTVAALVLSIFTLINMQPQLIVKSSEIFQAILAILSTVFAITILLSAILAFVSKHGKKGKLWILPAISGLVLIIYIWFLIAKGIFP